VTLIFKGLCHCQWGLAVAGCHHSMTLRLRLTLTSEWASVATESLRSTTRLQVPGRAMLTLRLVPARCLAAAGIVQAGPVTIMMTVKDLCQ
jgi:hypothetical protein